MTSVSLPESVERLKGSLILKTTRQPSVLWPKSRRAIVEVRLCITARSGLLQDPLRLHLVADHGDGDDRSRLDEMRGCFDGSAP